MRTAELNRREFLQRASMLAAAAALGEALGRRSDARERATADGTMPRRPLGRTGVEVSVLGIGGYTLATAKDENEATRIVREAIDAGIDFFDNAWEYHDGRAEEWMGRALEGRRDKVVLMTKVCTHGRDATVAMRQLEDSLRRLRTDHLDVWQIHEVIYDDDPDRIFRKGGAIEALDQAKRQGKVRFVGFTGHKDPSIHLKMLAHDYPFDTVQMPLNPWDGQFRSFERQVLPELTRRGIAPIAMKSLSGNGVAVTAKAITVPEALRYVFSLPIATLVSGIDSIDVLRQNVAIARTFTPITPDERQALLARCAQFAGDGRFELYKTSKRFDGAPGREQHGFPDGKTLPL